eukprot:6816657-Pyramimonas_sp.AAC.1
MMRPLMPSHVSVGIREGGHRGKLALDLGASPGSSTLFTRHRFLDGPGPEVQDSTRGPTRRRHAERPSLGTFTATARFPSRRG